MLKGLCITPPVIGRISIGRVVERNGKRLPEKDDQFTITTQVRNRDGWILHPLDDELRKDSNTKLRSIPVRVLFNDPELNLRAEYTAFDKQTGRPICIGNGELCKRITPKGVEAMSCPAPEACNFGKGLCKPYGRLNVSIGDEDELGSFIFRTTSFNSIRTLMARLRYFHAVSRGLLSSMPLELKLRGKSTTQSHGSAIYYVDLAVRAGLNLESAVIRAKELDERRQGIGFDQNALDKTARSCFENGLFEDSDEETEAVTEEFFPHAPEADSRENTGSASLKEKLLAKVTT